MASQAAHFQVDARWLQQLTAECQQILREVQPHTSAGWNQAQQTRLMRINSPAGSAASRMALSVFCTMCNSSL
jgi:hypothetical protein